MKQYLQLKSNDTAWCNTNSDKYFQNLFNWKQNKKRNCCHKGITHCFAVNKFICFGIFAEILSIIALRIFRYYIHILTQLFFQFNRIFVISFKFLHTIKRGDYMDNIYSIIGQLPNELKSCFMAFDNVLLSNITEIRLRINKPIIIYILDKPYLSVNMTSLSIIIPIRSDI